MLYAILLIFLYILSLINEKRAFISFGLGIILFFILYDVSDESNKPQIIFGQCVWAIFLVLSLFHFIKKLWNSIRLGLPVSNVFVTNKWVKKNLVYTDALKLVLLRIFSFHLEPLILINESYDVEESKVISRKYSAYIINDLFGDSNDAIQDLHIYQKLDVFYRGFFGEIINKNYPELKSTITDGVLRYYIASQNKRKKSKEKILLPSEQLGLVDDGFKPLSDKAYLSLIDKYENIELVNDMTSNSYKSTYGKKID